MAPLSIQGNRHSKQNHIILVRKSTDSSGLFFIYRFAGVGCDVNKHEVNFVAGIAWVYIVAHS